MKRRTNREANKFIGCCILKNRRDEKIEMEEVSENYWEKIKEKKRIVVKVGSSTLTHKDTGNLNYSKLEKLVRAISNLKNSGKEVILVSSGAVACRKRNLKNRN